jgi:Predicted pyridoxal phosphate-dependent enzyme apparently involved in regulation of cell wall biogenesis
MNKRIHLSLATITGSEQKFIQQAFDTNWIAPLGPNIDGFEKDLEEYLGEGKKVVALSSGTAAIHLGLIMLGVKSDDEVLVQDLCFVAAVNPVSHLHARPVLIDSEEDTWNISPEKLEEAIIDRKKTTGKYPRAIVFVDLYGTPAKFDEILLISKKYDIPVLEDAANALGSTYKERQCGTFGTFGCLSFNGNKIITTSGGGALICNNEDEAKRALFLATQARENRPYYYHEEVGYNYRLSNICAGIGRGQMLSLQNFVERRRAIHQMYVTLLHNVDGIIVHDLHSSRQNYWLTCILVNPEKTGGVTCDDIRLHLESKDIESRRLWRPMHMQPIYKNCPFYGDGVSEKLFNKGLCLPSGAGLTDEEVHYIVEAIKEIII